MSDYDGSGDDYASLRSKVGTYLHFQFELGFNGGGGCFVVVLYIRVCVCIYIYADFVSIYLNFFF